MLQATETILAELISFPTVSSDSNLDMMGWMADRLEHHGAKVELFADSSGAKANMFATIGPDVPGGVVLSGHSDVVPVTDQVWHSSPIRPHRAQRPAARPWRLRHEGLHRRRAGHGLAALRDAAEAAGAPVLHP